MAHLKKATAVLGIIVAAALIAAPGHGQKEGAQSWLFTRPLQVGDTTFNVAVADSAEERKRGLSGVRAMGPNQGLYFVFPRAYLLSFWMKDMRFAIDIVWIDSAHRVIHMIENVTPETFPMVFTVQQPAQYALEIKAGRARAAGIKIGDTVSLH